MENTEGAFRYGNELDCPSHMFCEARKFRQDQYRTTYPLHSVKHIPVTIASAQQSDIQTIDQAATLCDLDRLSRN